MPAAPQIFRSRWFFAGLALGLALLAWAGRRAAASDYHPNFTRFFPAVSPEANYFPTVGELQAIVRARCRPGQVLVIVGGNSVLHGVWQPAAVMWTRKLQERLGDGYCVVNFALRGATPTDGGAVVAESLRDEFPRQIYLANERAATRILPLGNDTYLPIFWQAYFSGMLLDDPARNAGVRAELLHPQRWAQALAIAGGATLDRALRFRDLWNRLAFQKLNTVPSPYAPAPPGMFSPRKLFVDEERDGTSLTTDERYLPAARGREMEILRATSATYCERTAAPDTTTDGWRIRPPARAELAGYFRAAFPAALRPRTLMLVGRDTPFYRDRLTAAERARDEAGIRESVALFRECGYAALDYGDGWTAEDYSDRTHLAPGGGEKLADTVAPAVRALAVKLGYRR